MIEVEAVIDSEDCTVYKIECAVCSKTSFVNVVAKKNGSHKDGRDVRYRVVGNAVRTSLKK